jgi:hypothetical protein
MTPITPPASPSFEQVLMLVRQLPDRDKLMLSRELEFERDQHGDLLRYLSLILVDCLTLTLSKSLA